MAVFGYGKLRSAAEGVSDYRTIEKTFIKRAAIYLKLKEYQFSLRMFKLLLKYAWLEKNVEHEFDAYKGIAICYYYQGLLKKSNFYYKRYVKGKKEPLNSNMRLYSIKRYTNEFEIKQLRKRSEKTRYTETVVYKIRDSTIDYSIASKFIDGSKDSQIAKRTVYLKLETPVAKLRDKDLPSPSIGNNSKGNLFLRMRKAKKILKDIKTKEKEAEGEVEVEEVKSTDSSELPIEEVEKLIDGRTEEKNKNILLFKDDSESSQDFVRQDSSTRIPFFKKKKDPMSIDYLKMQQNEREDHEKIIAMRMQAIEKGLSPMKIANSHRDSGKSKTNIILSHLRKEEFENSLLRADRKKTGKILQSLKKYIEEHIKMSFVMQEDRIREVTHITTLYYF